MSHIVKQKEYDFVFDASKCQECEGSCCIGESGYIWISKIEIEKLAHHLQMSIEKFALTYLIKVGYKYSLKEIKLEKNNYACVFFDTNKKACSIYEFRPTQCRTFPFWEHFKTNKEEVFKECLAVQNNS
jgi:Fe-S-cluster containining protein